MKHNEDSIGDLAVRQVERAIAGQQLDRLTRRRLKAALPTLRAIVDQFCPTAVTLDEQGKAVQAATGPLLGDRQRAGDHVFLIATNGGHAAVSMAEWPQPPPELTKALHNMPRALAWKTICDAVASNNVSLAICTVACLLGSHGIAVAVQAAADWRKRGALPAVCVIGGEGSGKWCGLVQVIALPQPIDLMLAEVKTMQ